MVKNEIDKYLNVLYQTVAEPSTGVGIVAKVNTQFSSKDKTGILIKGLEWTLLATTLNAAFVADLAKCQLALSHFSNNDAPVTGPSKSGIINFHELSLFGIGTPADSFHLVESVHRIWFPEPVIAHPASLYISVIGNGCAAAISTVLRIYYTYIDLTDAEYQEMLQSYILQNVL